MLFNACSSVLLTLVKMTGNDFGPNFRSLWQYANGSLPRDQFEDCISKAQVGLDKLAVEISK